MSVVLIKRDNKVYNKKDYDVNNDFKTIKTSREKNWRRNEER